LHQFSRLNKLKVAEEPKMTQQSATQSSRMNYKWRRTVRVGNGQRTSLFDNFGQREDIVAVTGGHAIIYIVYVVLFAIIDVNGLSNASQLKIQEMSTKIEGRSQ
jgi:hypothetical protein